MYGSPLRIPQVFHLGTFAFDIHNLLQVHGAKHSIFYAAYFGHHYMLEMLLQEGQDAATINRRYFSTALHLSCEAGNVECADTLLKANIAVHLTRGWGSWVGRRIFKGLVLGCIDAEFCN